MMVTTIYPPSFIDELAVALFDKIKFLAAAEPKGPQNTGQLLTVSDVAKKAKRCEKTVLKWITSGRLNAVNQGTLARPSYRIAEADWLAANSKR
jgi:hypothetical protein